MQAECTHLHQATNEYCARLGDALAPFARVVVFHLYYPLVSSCVGAGWEYFILTV